MVDYTDKYLKYKNRYLMDKKQGKSILDYFFSDNNTRNHTGPAMVLVKSDSCGHCIEFKDAWNTIARNRDNTCKFISYDINKDMHKIDKLGHDIVGVPEIMMISLDNGTPIKNSQQVYNGSREPPSLNSFITDFFDKLPRN